MKSLFIFYVICTFLFFSCLKQDLRSKNAVSAPTQGKSGVKPACIPCNDTIAVRINSNNPYDSAGSRHNEGVRTVFPTINIWSNNIDSEVLANVKPYLASIQQDTSTFQIFYESSVQNGYFPFSHLPRLDSLGNTLYT